VIIFVGQNYKKTNPVGGYYDRTLSAERLKRCYEIAPSRVRQYFEAELNHVLKIIHRKDFVLDLGCGYGRIIPVLAEKAKYVFGIDTSLSSLILGKEMLEGIPHVMLQKMDAIDLAFGNEVFDVVLCLQNGVSAFHVDQKKLICESIRVTKPGGRIFFSSYSEKFWDHRLEWFVLQSKAGLLGEIDFSKTKDGVIVCKDGFSASTVSPEGFRILTSTIKNVEVKIEEVDESCIFCEIIRR